jgi:hypothetical protein
MLANPTRREWPIPKQLQDSPPAGVREGSKNFGQQDVLYSSIRELPYNIDERKQAIFDVHCVTMMERQSCSVVSRQFNFPHNQAVVRSRFVLLNTGALLI